MTKLKEMWIGFDPPKVTEIRSNEKAEKILTDKSAKVASIAKAALAEVSDLCEVIEYRYILNRRQKQ